MNLKLAFLAFLVFISYANSLGGEFLSDDIAGIRDNNNIGNFQSVLSQPLAFIRPLLYFLTFKIGGISPFLFHLGNLFWHLGNTWLVYLVINLLSKPPLALLTAGIFAVHPLLTESVTWISGGIYAQYSFFILICLLTYVLYYQSQKNLKFWAISFAGFLAALASSEKAIVLPVILLAWVVCFGNLSKNWKSLVPFWMVGFLFALALLKGIGQRTTTLQTQFYQEPTIANPLIQIPVALTSYLELIFWPKNLTLYHSEMVFTTAQYSTRLVGLALFLGILVFFLKKNRRIFFWLAFLPLSLLPVLTPWGLSWIVAERYVYLGTIGILVVVAAVIQKIAEKLKNQKIAYYLFAVILLLLSTRTIVRNIDWQNQNNLWLATARTSPSSPQNHNNLGDLYGRQGNLEKAAEEFKIAIKLKPNYGDAYHNLANIYHQMDKDDLAAENYLKALSFNHGLWQSHQNLAAIYFNRGEFSLSLQELQKAVNISPENPNLYANLGVVFLKLNEKPKAKEAFLKALRFDPQNQKLRAIITGL